MRVLKKNWRIEIHFEEWFQLNGNDFSLIARIRKLAKSLVDESDQALRQRGLSLKYQATTTSSIDRILPLAFALACEAARRTIGMTPYDVQIYGGLQIARGHIAEMKTGEGKTLTAILPVYAHALRQLGAHVVTVNDYLAQRDFQLMGPVYETLGLSVGVVQADDPPEQRRRAYLKDITYGTAKELGFDFLRDRLQLAGSNSRLPDRSEQVMRDLHFVLVDEADSVLIDEARTPLIIGIVDQAEERKKQVCFRWAAVQAQHFIENRDFKYDQQRRTVELTLTGVARARGLPQSPETQGISARTLHQYLEHAIKVRRDFQLDQHYVIREGKVAIVDEFTGRVAEGRQWQGGIHQSVEAKEGLEITPATRTGATVTMQTFFRRYHFFGGMTGTAWTSKAEFRKVYKKKVVRVPTHRPVIRRKLPTIVLGSFARKVSAIADEAAEMVASGRAVLIGTRSVERSEAVARVLTARQICHEVLNANHDAREAEIVAESGRHGRVTVATNMAGRGTDILLDDAVRKAGGLHVILTEIHESQRIDWQLIGRGGRQGDLGSYRIFVSMEDELLRLGLGDQKSEELATKYRASERPLPTSCFRWFLAAQRKLERKFLVDRMVMMRQDQERQERHFEMGLDPYCDVVQS